MQQLSKQLRKIIFHLPKDKQIFSMCRFHHTNIINCNLLKNKTNKKPLTCDIKLRLSYTNINPYFKTDMTIFIKQINLLFYLQNSTQCLIYRI